MKRFAFQESEMACVLMLMSHGQERGAQPMPVPAPLAGRGDRAPERTFVCKTCNRVFPSFQALGGHRASHKKPRLDADGGGDLSLAKPKLHGCSICGLEFAIGQALGGHMRRHRAMTGGMPPAIVVDKKPDTNDDASSTKRGLWLDLNHPPCDDGAGTDVECVHNATGITFHQFMDTGTIAVDCVGY